MPRWLQLGAAAAAGAVVADALTLQLNDLRGDEALVAQVVSAHARAVLTSHQLDVISSDRHAVKPWLSARLDFSPRVVELVKQKQAIFHLGRLDEELVFLCGRGIVSRRIGEMLRFLVSTRGFHRPRDPLEAADIVLAWRAFDAIFSIHGNRSES
jgi:hypothetical protein